MKTFIKLNNNDNHLSWGNFTRIVKEHTVNKTAALQTELFCCIFNIDNINDTTVNNYCTGIRAINNSYKQIYINYKKKYEKDSNCLIETITNLLTIIEGSIYNTYNVDNINNNSKLNDILDKLYNISKNDKEVPNSLSKLIKNDIDKNNLYDAIVNILFFIILEKNQPLYESDVKVKAIESILSNTDISSKDLEDYLYLKFSLGFNYDYLLKKLANEGNAYACYEMAMNEYKGTVSGERRFDVCSEYLLKAAEYNHPNAFYMLGKLLLQGRIGNNLKDDYDKAYNYLLKAYELGNVGAINSIGNMYLNGTYPLNKDLNKAIECFNEAAKKEFPFAYNNLGKLEEDNENYKEALNYYLKSADLGEAWACNKCGEYYRLGLGVNKDLTKAFDYYNKSISQHIDEVPAYAFYNLAKYFYYNGCYEINIRKDEDLAIELYKKGSKIGCIDAMIELLFIYINKYLSTKDNNYKIEAYQYKIMIETHKDYNDLIRIKIEDILKKLNDYKEIDLGSILS